jgi:hypothetical protein
MVIIHTLHACHMDALDQDAAALVAIHTVATRINLYVIPMVVRQVRAV